MNKYDFNIEKIVNFLKDYKNDLPQLYNWKAKLDKLVEFNILSHSEIKELPSKVSYEREIILKKKIKLKLHEYFKADKGLFYKLCLWIIKDWGGIKSAKDSKTVDLINEFLETGALAYSRIASISKIAAFMYPEKYIIYDSRVAYSLNWIILSMDAGDYYFPIPKGRNSKMMAFDMNVLIRLKNIDHYSPSVISEMEKKQYVNNKDKSKYIHKSEAYAQLNTLVKDISLKLWTGEKTKNILCRTEMLLFSIADKEIFMDITKSLSLKINKC